MHPSISAVLQPSALFHERYRVVRAIKAGGMGVVYEVVDETTKAARALKVMLPLAVDNPDHRARFAREATITGGIESDHIVRVTDAGIDAASGTPFIAMELLRGEELADIVVKRRTLPPAEVVTYLWQAALALDKTHAAGIVHRDLKPENLFVTRRDDGSPCVKIFDFGIAKVVSGDQAPKTRALGTPLYMAPEQIRGASAAIGPPADLYTLGHIAYAALAGEAYWVEEGEASDDIFPLLLKIAAGPREPAGARALRRTGAALPAGFDAWFFKATAARWEDRFDRATTMVAALAEAVGVPSPGPSALPWTTVTAEPAEARAEATTGPVNPTPLGPGLTVKIVTEPRLEALAASPAPAPAQERTETIDVVVGKAAAPASRSATAFALGAMAVLAVGGVGFGLLRGQGAAPGSAAPAVVSAAPVVAASAPPASTETASATATASAAPVVAASASAVPAVPSVAKPFRKTALPPKAPDKATPPKPVKDGIF